MSNKINLFQFNQNGYMSGILDNQHSFTTKDSFIRVNNLNNDSLVEGLNTINGNQYYINGNDVFALPSNTTMVPPPKNFNVGEVRVFDKNTNTWSLVEDWTVDGKGDPKPIKLYDKDTMEEKYITDKKLKPSDINATHLSPQIAFKNSRDLMSADKDFKLEGVKWSNEENTWIIDESLKVSQIKNKLVSTLNNDYDNTLKAVVAKYPESEQKTFSVQIAEADAYMENDTASTPFIDGLLINRTDVTKEELVTKIIYASNALKQVSAYLTGVRQAKEKEIQSINEPTVSETLAKLKTVTWNFSIPT